MASQTVKATKSARSAGIETILWLLLVVLVPLWVNLWGQQPFELPKVSLMRTLVWLLAGLFLTDLLQHPKRIWGRFSNNPLLFPLVLFAVVIGVTTITAVNPRLSLWGSYDRQQGAVTHLTYLLLCWLASDKRPFPVVKQLLQAMALATLPLVLFGFAQAFGWNPFGFTTDARSAIYGTLGRANFVGAYLALLLPLTLAFLLLAHQKSHRFLWSGLLMAQMVLIGLTLARGAWLATAVSLTLFALLWWQSRLSNVAKWIGWGTIGLLFVSGPLIVLLIGPQTGGSLAARGAIWRGSWTLIGKRPFLGYGADAIGLIFPQVYPPELVYFQGREFFVDRAHNLLLEWGIIAGIPGMLAMALLLGTFIFIISQALRRPQASKEKRLLLIALLAGVGANLANNLVSFDVTPTALAFWLFIGLGTALAQPDQPIPAQDSSPRPFWHRLALVGTFLMVLGAIWQGNGRLIFSDIAARSAHQLSHVGNHTQAITMAENAVAYWPFEPAHHLLLAQLYLQSATANSPVNTEWLPQAETALQQAQRLRPTDPFIALQRAEFYAFVAQRFGGNTEARAEEAYRQAQRLAPNHAIIYTASGRFYVENGAMETAVLLLRRAIQLDATNGLAYLYLGHAEQALDEHADALSNYREAVRLMPSSSQATAALARYYWQQNQPQEALFYAEQALRLAPNDQELQALIQEITAVP